MNNSRKRPTCPLCGSQEEIKEGSSLSNTLEPEELAEGKLDLTAKMYVCKPCAKPFAERYTLDGGFFDRRPAI